MRVDAIADTYLMIDLNGDIVLPENANAFMNDGSIKAVPVLWESCDVSVMKHSGAARYTIRGSAGGMPALCQADMVEYNYLKNYSFEEPTSACGRLKI